MFYLNFFQSKPCNLILEKQKQKNKNKKLPKKQI